MDTILSFIDNLAQNTTVEISKKKLVLCSPWFYDESSGTIHNRARSFFEISGITFAGNEKK